MRALKLLLILSALSLSLFANEPPDAKKQTDALRKRLVSYLAEEGLSPQVDKEGDISLIFHRKNGRTQQVFISLEAWELSSSSYFKMWTRVKQGIGDLDADTANRILAFNGKRVFPKCHLSKAGDKYVIIAASFLPYDITKDRFLDAFGSTAVDSDNLEEIETKADEF